MYGLMGSHKITRLLDSSLSFYGKPLLSIKVCKLDIIVSVYNLLEYMLFMLDLVIFLQEIITLHLRVLNFTLLKFLSSCNLNTKINQ